MEFFMEIRIRFSYKMTQYVSLHPIAFSAFHVTFPTCQITLAQNMKFSTKDFFSTCNQILNGKLHFFVQCQFLLGLNLKVVLKSHLYCIFENLPYGVRVFLTLLNIAFRAG